MTYQRLVSEFGGIAWSVAITVNAFVPTARPETADVQFANPLVLVVAAPFTVTLAMPALAEADPGIYKGMLSDDYFADPTPEPSLSQSVAKILIEQSPLHARQA